MFEWLTRRIKIAALKRTLSRKAPSQFSYSTQTNYFVSFLEHTETGKKLLVDRIEGLTLHGHTWGTDRFDEETSILLSELDNWKFSSRRFYGFGDFEYKGLGSFFFHEVTLLPQRIYLSGWLTQKLYNHTTRFRHDRNEVLKKLIALHMEEAKKNNAILFVSSEKSVVGLLAQVYGNRVYGHPNHEEFAAHFRLVLESLCETGELSKSNLHEFKLNAVAVASVSNYELEERRHQDSVKQNRLLLVLTLVMALAAVLQAMAAFNT